MQQEASNKKIVVAIDGHSSCGKSTMAKQLAKQLGYIYVDTGAMYRGVTLFALRNGYIQDGKVKVEALEQALPELKLEFRLSAETKLPELYIGDECVEQEIRTMEVAQQVSPIAALPFVRERLTQAQKAMGREKGIVMDGRDIGTAVFPEAELKVFVTAQPEVRAQRRLLELRAKGDSLSTLEEVLENINSRDEQDANRAVSPLRKAEDAKVLDNSNLSREEQSALLLSWAREVIGD